MIDGIVTEVMVHMAMCSEQMLRFQIILANIVDDSLSLLLIIGATVDDDAFLGIIIHHVAIFRDHIHLKSFDMYHNILII